MVLIDFWTYSCINCVRTLPYLKSWYEKYHDKGLVIIGIHTPEFDFEKTVTNVTQAVNKEGIKYPVALDNLFITWQNFSNQFWPAHYLINQQGKVVYQHFKLWLNGETLVAHKGKHVENSSILVDKYSLYEAVVFPQSSNGTLQISPEAPGLDIYTFTFGG